MREYMNIKDFFIVGVMAFAAVWIINRGLKAANLSQYEA